jgi:hypothetical protein
MGRELQAAYYPSARAKRGKTSTLAHTVPWRATAPGDLPQTSLRQPIAEKYGTHRKSCPRQKEPIHTGGWWHACGASQSPWGRAFRPHLWGLSRNSICNGRRGARFSVLWRASARHLRTTARSWAEAHDGTLKHAPRKINSLQANWETYAALGRSACATSGGWSVRYLG